MKTEPSALRVLIADDFEPVRRRLAEMLAEVPGVEIAGQSATVKGTLAAIQTLVPDVVTLDLSMPDGNGLEVLRRTRGQQARPVFIVLSNFSSAEYRNEAIRQDAHAFLDKSREFEKAIELIYSFANKAAGQVERGSKVV
jgi:DNA-binding NarL/FixJ family response regulator